MLPCVEVIVRPLEVERQGRGQPSGKSDKRVARLASDDRRPSSSCDAIDTKASMLATASSSRGRPCRAGTCNSCNSCGLSSKPCGSTPSSGAYLCRCPQCSYRQREAPHGSPRRPPRDSSARMPRRLRSSVRQWRRRSSVTRLVERLPLRFTVRRFGSTPYSSAPTPLCERRPAASVAAGGRIQVDAVEQHAELGRIVTAPGRGGSHRFGGEIAIRLHEIVDTQRGLGADRVFRRPS